jgi:hypothetical protein
MKLWMWLRILGVGVGACCHAAELKNQLYSENGFVSQENSIVSSLRLRSGVSVLGWVEPFLQLGSEAQTLGQLQHRLDDGASYFYYGPGLVINHFNLSAIVEWRQRAFYKLHEDQNSRDLRASLIFNHQILSQVSAKQSYLQELYGEGVLTTADDSNTIFTVWGRFGMRTRISSHWNLDGYGEPFGVFDTRSRLYNRRVEFRPTIRAQYLLGQLLVGISGAYVVPIAGKMDSSNGSEGRPSGFRFLAVVGGDL